MFRISCAFDVVVKMIRKRLSQLPSDLPEAFDGAVAHPEIFATLKRMTVHLANAHAARGCADMSEEARRFDVAGEPLQVLVVPGGSETSKVAGSCDLRRVPANAEAVAVERFFAFSGFKALKDQRVLRTVEQVG